jgi:hypothetical protein
LSSSKNTSHVFVGFDFSALISKENSNLPSTGFFAWLSAKVIVYLQPSHLVFEMLTHTILSSIISSAFEQVTSKVMSSAISLNLTMSNSIMYFLCIIFFFETQNLVFVLRASSGTLQTQSNIHISNSRHLRVIHVQNGYLFLKKDWGKKKVSATPLIIMHL